MPVAVHPAASLRRALPAARQPNRSPPFDSSDTRRVPVLVRRYEARKPHQQADTARRP